jgi:mannose-6-phosphate isomerase-like protein (cupin superfamily)
MHIQATAAIERLYSSKKLFLELFNHGNLTIEIYKPFETDLQKPHERNEVYMIICGKGEFFNGEDLVTFTSGDLIFVPAGVEHRFINFTADFLTWVIFY